mmetsp:Transcript_28186/g.27032  ORF Transcript_28186/g.27032 Transcript_28186/m.27032 type:complete len:86 (+) Transcript_28186:560-817(+)
MRSIHTLVTSDAHTSAANIIWQDKLISRVNGENIIHHKIFFDSEDASANLEIGALSKFYSWEFSVQHFMIDPFIRVIIDPIIIMR